MTDATREQIARDALKWWKDNDGPIEDPDGLFEDAWTDGATHQHPIAEKAGYNQAIDAAIEIVRSVDPAFIVQELEALKTEIKK